MNRSFGYLTCFITGLVILVVELAAFRLLAPYFGTSSYVVGAIINTILLALAVGYVIGGLLVDRYASRQLPYWAVLAAAVYLAAVYVYYPPLLGALADHSVIIGSVAATFVLFFVPMLLLAAVPPYLIKLLIVEDKAGTASGFIFSVSTLGSILGGVLTTYLLIPYLGSRTSVGLSVGALFVLAALGLAVARRALAMVALGALLPLWIRPEPPHANTVHREESEYNLITVAEAYGRRLLLLNDNLGIQSVSLDPQTHLAENFYSDAFLLPLLLADRERTLVLGNAAGAVMTAAAHYFDTEVVGVEIDPAVTAVGERYFDLRLDDPKLSVVHQDGRVFLNRNRERFDLVIVDMYGGGPYVPFHVATAEFFAQAATALSEHGVLAINLPFFAEDTELERRYLATIGRSFGQAFRYRQVLYAFKTPTTREALQAALARRDRPAPLADLGERIMANLAAVELPRDSAVFTDDHAPVEKLTSEAITAEWYAKERELRRERLGY